MFYCIEATIPNWLNDSRPCNSWWPMFPPAQRRSAAAFGSEKEGRRVFYLQKDLHNSESYHINLYCVNIKIPNSLLCHTESTRKMHVTCLEKGFSISYLLISHGFNQNVAFQHAPEFLSFHGVARPGMSLNLDRRRSDMSSEFSES